MEADDKDIRRQEPPCNKFKNEKPVLSSIDRPLQGIKIADCLCIELCAGSAGLSSSLKKTGFQVLPVDHKANRHNSRVACTCIDLSHPSAFSILRAVIDNSILVYTHSAPPCGTASKARERPISKQLLAQGAPAPRPLRSTEFPEGMPGLTENEQARVDSANKIYKLISDIILYLIFRGVLFSVENPLSSYFWLCARMPEIRAKPEVESNPFQSCMQGGERDKWSDWTATKGLLRPLRMACDKSHNHKAWGFVENSTSWEFATATEAEYPQQLCNNVASLVLHRCLEMGATETATSLFSELSSDQNNALARSRTFRQARGRKIPQVVSEFGCVTEFQQKPNESDHRYKLVRLFNRGIEGSNQLTDSEVPNQLTDSEVPVTVPVFIVGEYREPLLFLEAAKLCKHPLDIRKAIPDITLQAIFDVITLGPVQISKKRIQALQKIKETAASLEASELRIHAGLSKEVSHVLAGKKLALLSKLLDDNEYPDKNLANEIRKGFMLTGVGARSGDLPSRIVSATITPSDLKGRSKIAQALVERTTRSSGDPSLDQQVYEQTMEEVQNGWISGPFAPGQITEMLGNQWVASRRFGLKQGMKVRAIDDASEPGINDCFTSTEKLQLMGVDFVADVCSEIQSCIEGNRIELELSGSRTLKGTISKDWGGKDNALSWIGRTLDLKSAYKQLAIAPEDQWCSVLAVYSPAKQGVEYFISRALLFGSTSSVYAFNRVARSIWFLVSKCLSLVCGQFFDDFPCIEPCASSGISKSVFQLFLDAIGWRWSTGDKDKQFDKQFKALGVAFDLSCMKSGSFEIKNTAERVEAIKNRVLEIVGRRNITRAESSELLGRMQYASCQIMGRTVLPTIAVLARCASQHKPAWPLVSAALNRAVQNLEMSNPRIIRKGSSDDKTLLIFTDGAWENGNASWGVFVHDCNNGSSTVAGGIVPQPIIDFWKTVVGEQLICQIELWPILLIRHKLTTLVSGRKIVWFIDNEPSKEGLIRGYSGSAASAALVQEFYDAEAKNPTSSWFSRVPSFSNPADMPSRNETELCAKTFGAKIFEIACFTEQEIQSLISRTQQFLT